MRFRDYWESEGGARARKVDWTKTWKNWMRTAAERKPGAQKSVTADRVRQAIESGKRVQAMLNGEL